MPSTSAEQTSWLRRQMRITWHLPIMLACLLLALTITYLWSWLSSTHPRVITLAGSHAEIGLAHGQVLRQEIHQLFDEYIVGGLVAREGWPLEDLVAVGRHYEAFIPSAYCEEMRGIAHGSGLAYEHILVMNTFPDAVLGANPALRQASGEAAVRVIGPLDRRPIAVLGACSAFAVRTDAGILVGRNLDWTNFGAAHRYAMVFLLEPSHGHRVLSVGWPGMAGVITGMNDQGLSVTLNMAFASDPQPDSTPFLLRLRQILERGASVQEACESLIGEPRSFAGNVLVAGGREDTAVVVELSGRRHALVAMEDGLVVTTNHYQRLDIKGGAGYDRSAMLEEQLSRTGMQTTPRQAQRALARVCFRGSSLGMVTNQSVVFQLAELSARVAVGKLPASSGRYYEIRMP